jgi:hypothetical protein
MHANLLLLLLVILIERIEFTQSREHALIPLDVQTRCPIWKLTNTTFAFTKTDGLHNMADGINMFKNRLFDLLYGSICHRRHVVEPGVRLKFDSPKTTEFSRLFDINSFNAYLYAHHGIFIVPKHCMSGVGPLKDRPYDNHTCLAKGEEKYLNNTIVRTSWQTIENPLAIRKHLTVHLKAAPRLLRMAYQSRRHMNQKYVCIHMRTEHDFKAYQRNKPPGYNSMEEIVEKLRLTMQRNSSLFAGINDVYVAGDHSNTDVIEKAFGALFRRVLTKAVFLRNNTDLSYMETALIDQEICEKSDVFVGNNHSAWSELVYYLRVLLSEKKAPRSMNYVNFQYNSMYPNEKIESPMHQFCTAREYLYFARNCHYYRLF